MNRTATLERVIEEVHRHSMNHYDQVVPVQEMEFDSLNQMMDEFPLILQGVISQSRRGHDRFQISTQTPVDRPESTIDTFARQFQIPQEEAQIVKQAFYLESGPATMFHVINAITRGARDASLSASSAYRLEKAGGQILGMVRP
jgi:hypothetical protein